MEHTLISKVESLEQQTALHKLQIDELTRKMLANKRVMNMEEACLYSGISKSTLYKLTCKGEIPHYKPSGKLIFFERDEFDAWLLGNRVKTRDEISREAMNYLMKKNLKP